MSSSKLSAEAAYIGRYPSILLEISLNRSSKGSRVKFKTIRRLIPVIWYALKITMIKDNIEAQSAIAPTLMSL